MGITYVTTGGVPVPGAAAAVAVIAVLAAVLALAAAVRARRRTRRVLKSLERMLDEAMAGTFAERNFDESLLSAVEARFAHYLASNAVSAQRLQEEKDNIKTLIADISHQIKTPVANVLLYAQLLGEQELDQEGRACAGALEQQALKLQTLADVLVKISRLETGVLALHPQPGPLAPMLEQAAAQYTPRAAEKGLTLSLSPTDAAAVFDRKWTAEALCNLLDNAVKYTPSGGAVTVRVTVYEMFCRIDVADTGPGIPEEEHAKVFQRFYRSAAAHDAEGVGIGLYLARRIAEGQGGYIKVSSRPGQGSCFSLCLPRS